MARLFDGKVFYHIPKTGGNYVRRVIQITKVKLGIHSNEIGHSHSNILNNPELIGLESFTVIRHPLEWYKSFYRFREQKKWGGNHTRGIHKKGDTFEQFILKMIDAYPSGYVTNLYMTNIPFVCHILKTENLTKDLKALFEKWEYPFPNRVSNINVTKDSSDISLAKKTEDKILKVEQKILGYFEK